MKDIELGGGYRLHRRDSMNWELQHWHGADPNHHLTKTTAPKWKSCGKYYQTLGGALAAVFELRMRDGDECGDLGDAMERAEAIRAELLAARARIAEAGE